MSLTATGYVGSDQRSVMLTIKEIRAIHYYRLLSETTRKK